MFIEILTGGSQEHGFGHIKRSNVLAKYFTSAGHNVLLRNMTHSISNPVEFLDMPYVDCRIMDLPPKLEMHFEERIESQRILVSLDGISIPSDLNFTIYKHTESQSTRNYIGYEYTIISDEFLTYRNLPFVPTRDFKNVCVCLGGCVSIYGRELIRLERKRETERKRERDMSRENNLVGEKQDRIVS